MRVAMGRWWFWSHCDTSRAQSVYYVREDIFFDRLVLGFTVLPGRWFKNANPVALLKLLSGCDMCTNVRKSTGESLFGGGPEALEWGGTNWQCSKCEAFSKMGCCDLCQSCYQAGLEEQRRPEPPAPAQV
jgi:hypothetical protein